MNDSLTFGVELEFICVYERNTFTNNPKYPGLVPNEDNGELGGYVQAGHAIWYVLNSAHIPASGFEDIDAPPIETYSQWIIDEDASVHLSSEEKAYIGDNYETEAIEIASPVLKLTEPHDLIKVQQVLNLLRWMEIEFGCMFLANESCGMHVHVGCGQGNPIPIAIAKRVFQLTTAHEHNIDALHAASRIRAPVVPEGPDRYPHYAPLSFFHRRAKAASKHDNVFDWLNRIEKTRDFLDFERIFQVTWALEGGLDGGHSSAVNFDNLFREKQTIEFRQHLGTLEPTEVTRYVLFLGYLITYCFQTDEDKFIELLLKATDPAFRIADLMCTIDIPVHVTELFAPASNIHTQSDSVTDVILAAPLQALKAFNANTIIKNKSQEMSGAARDRKWALEIYGIHRDVGAMYINFKLVQRMTYAALQHQFGNHVAELDEISSQARSTVFTQLAEMYRTGDYHILNTINC